MKICANVKCGMEHTRRRSKYCSNKCGKTAFAVPELRKKLSESRKKYLKDNPDKHPWKKSSKFKSNPCQIIKDYLNKNKIKFIEEFNPLEDRAFSIDIAFPDINVGIEVNGNQHYNGDGTLKEYYQQRHDLIVASGWKLIELHYSLCYNEDVIKNIIFKYEQPDYNVYLNNVKKKKLKEVTLPKGIKIKIKTDLKWEKYKDIIKNSEIDFSKFGWVQKVSELLNIKAQKVNKWMKRYLGDFYEHKCFKKKCVGVSHRSSKPALNA